MTEQEFYDFDILEVVSRYLPMEKHGNEYRGFCPYHDDKHGTLRVSPQKGFFYCDDCRAAGNAIRFYADREKISYRDAYERLKASDISREILPRTSSGEVYERLKALGISPPNFSDERPKG